MKRILWLALVLSACKTGLYGESNLDAGQPVGNIADLGSVYDASRSVDLGYSDQSLVAIDAATAIDLATPTADLAESADLTMVGGNAGQDLGLADDLAPSVDLALAFEQDLGALPDLVSSPDLANADLGQIIVIVPSVDLRSAVDLALAPAEDLAQPPDLTASPADLAAPALDLANRLDLVTSPADLVESLDLVALPQDLTVQRDLVTNNVDSSEIQDLVSATDLAQRPGTLKMALWPRFATLSYDVTNGPIASFLGVAIDFVNDGDFAVRVPQLKLTGTGAIENGAFSTSNLQSVVASCYLVDEKAKPYGNAAFVTGSGTINSPFLDFDLPGNSTKSLFAYCDEAGWLPPGPSSQNFCLGVASVGDVTAYDLVTGNAIVPVLDQNLVENSGTANQPVITTLFRSAADTTPPLITLYGDNPATVFLGSNYTDPGASAFDAVDGTVPVMMSGFVDLNTVGSYTLSYTATDQAGNTATATRTVNVIPPFCGTVTMNGTTVEAYGRVSVSWANDTPQGAASPGAEQLIGKVVLYADGSLSCEDVGIDAFQLQAYYSAPVGPVTIRKNFFNGPIVYSLPGFGGNGTVAQVRLGRGDLDIASGNSVTLYIVADTRAARTTDYLSIRVGQTITYTTLASAQQYTTDGQGGLPLIYKTFTY